MQKQKLIALLDKQEKYLFVVCISSHQDSQKFVIQFN